MPMVPILQSRPSAAFSPRADLLCRPATPADLPFLRQVYACTRDDELALLAWDAPMREAFIGMQFNAQQQHFQAQYPDAQQWLIDQAGEPTGRLWLHQDALGLHVLDITVLPRFRRQGIASACLRHVLRQADLADKPVHLHVLADNPIQHWYRQLGFCTMASPGLYRAMTRQPLGAQT
jgi:ribosomal protein S18 acetylase RimI-like enzyme